MTISPCRYLLCMVCTYAILFWISFAWVYLGIPYSMFLVSRGFVYYLNSTSWYVHLLETCRLIFIWVIIRCRPTKVQDSYCIPVIEADDSKLSVFDGSIFHPIRDCSLLFLSTGNPRIQSGLISGEVRCGSDFKDEWVLSFPHKLYQICCLKVFLISGLSIHSKKRRM